MASTRVVTGLCPVRNHRRTVVEQERKGTPSQVRKNSAFDFVLKGCGFSRTVTNAELMRL
jgi:hypothetical protein